MKSDEQLRQDAIDELHWDPAVDPSQIEVTVHDRIVTLSGSVPSYANKIAVEKAIQRMKDVKAFVIELAVKAPPDEVRSDSLVADSVLAVLGATEGLPPHAIGVTVQRGCVTLTGELDSGYQRRAAEIAAGRTRGVVGIVNKIRVRTEADPAQIREKIEAALERRAHAQAAKLDIDVREGVVTLNGTVGSLAERRTAEGVAWHTHGVRDVVNRLIVA
ncbi:MAG: BON domain-containing protein [Burkholderiales bacterium]|nr:BON domain-containing protein [Burkholderiales bacterium]TAM52109.1 MAG: BON domain-containing protein [Paraburkholderia sp.]